MPVWVKVISTPARLEEHFLERPTHKKEKGESKQFLGKITQEFRMRTRVNGPYELFLIHSLETDRFYWNVHTGFTRKKKGTKIMKLPSRS